MRGKEFRLCPSFSKRETHFSHVLYLPQRTLSITNCSLVLIQDEEGDGALPFFPYHCQIDRRLKEHLSEFCFPLRCARKLLEKTEHRQALFKPTRERIRASESGNLGVTRSGGSAEMSKYLRLQTSGRPE